MLLGVAAVVVGGREAPQEGANQLAGGGDPLSPAVEGSAGGAAGGAAAGARLGGGGGGGGGLELTSLEEGDHQRTGRQSPPGRPRSTGSLRKAGAAAPPPPSPRVGAALAGFLPKEVALGALAAGADAEVDGPRASSSR